MITLADLVPGALLFISGAALVLGALWLLAEFVWDEWRSDRRWVHIDRLARRESLFRRPRRGARVRRGRPWEAIFEGGSASRSGPRS